MAVRDWEYVPARLRGEPIGQRLEIAFNFHNRGTILSMTASESVVAKLQTLMGRRPLVPLVCKAGELDRTPAVLHRVSPPNPGKALGLPGGEASIDFYIDAEGRPRMPVAMRATHEAFAAVAAEALLQWRFEPPTRNGKPIAVRIVQDFVF